MCASYFYSNYTLACSCQYHYTVLCIHVNVLQQPCTSTNQDVVMRGAAHAASRIGPSKLPQRPPVLQHADKSA